MKKLINTSFIYAIAAMAGGVFYREFTKFNGFEGKTSLSIVHLHLFVMGMLFFLVLTLLDRQFSLTQHRHFGKFFLVYNLGLSLTVIMFLCRGIVQVLEVSLSSGANAAISGVSGLCHITLGVGIVWLFLIIKGRLKEEA